MKKLKKQKLYVMIALTLALVIGIQIPVSAYSQLSNPSNDSESFQLLAKDENNLILKTQEGIRTYKINKTYNGNVVFEYDNEGRLVEEYYYDSINNSVSTKYSGIEASNVVELDEEVKVNNMSISSNSHPPRYKTVSFSLSQLCVAVGVAISVTSLVGLVIAAAGGSVVIVTSIARAILSEAAGLSITIGGLVTNRGIRMRIKETYKKACRGSDCHYGYFGRTLVSWSTY